MLDAGNRASSEWRGEASKVGRDRAGAHPWGQELHPVRVEMLGLLALGVALVNLLPSMIHRSAARLARR